MRLPSSSQCILDHPHPAVDKHLCYACGMTTHDTRATSFVYRSGVSFCLRCWEIVPGAALRQVMQDVVLRADVTRTMPLDLGLTLSPSLAV